MTKLAENKSAKFSVLENGFIQSNVIAGYAMTVEDVISNVINNPAKNEILELHKLHKVADAVKYRAIKRERKCIKPHGTFYIEWYKDEKGKAQARTNLVKYSGFIYFEIDFDKLYADSIEETKALIHKLYGDKIYLMGISAGGKGLWLWIKADIPDNKITPENFLNLQKYLIEKVFTEINIDPRALGLCKSQVIPYDENVYHNDDAIPVTYPLELLTEERLF
jgi:hypothetical protein